MDRISENQYFISRNFRKKLYQGDLLCMDPPEKFLLEIFISSKATFSHKVGILFSEKTTRQVSLQK